MKEFKGTKGKLFLDQTQRAIRCETSLGTPIIASFFNNTLGEEIQQANMKLFCAAPEMLEMLNKCLLEFKEYKSSFGQGSQLENEIELLINKAIGE